MAYSTLPIAGIDLTSTQSAADIAAYGESVDFGPLGTQTFASDGLRYVWAVAAATIAPSRGREAARDCRGLRPPLDAEDGDVVERTLGLAPLLDPRQQSTHARVQRPRP